MAPLIAISPEAGLWGLNIVLDAAIKGAIVLALAGAASLLCRRRSAAVSHLVWSLAAAGLILVPVLSLSLPQWHVPVLPAWIKTGAGETKATTITAPTAVASGALAVDGAGPDKGALSDLGEQGQNAEVGAASDLRDIPNKAAVNVPALPADSAASVMRRGSSSDTGLHEHRASIMAANDGRHATPAVARWPARALLAYLAGAGLMLAWLLAGSLAIRHRSSRWRALTDAAWLDLLDQARRQLGLRRRVRLLLVPEASIPLTWGILRPVILLPAEAIHWPADRRQVVLLHELAHIKRADCLTQMIARLAAVIHWFNPLAHVAVRVLRVHRERACDDLVLASGMKPSNYAAHLLDIVRSLHTARWASLAAIAMAQKSQFEGRLLAILDANRNRRTPSRASLLAAAILVLIIIVPISILKATPAEESAKPGALAAASAATHNANGGQDAAVPITTIPATKMAASQAISSNSEGLAGAVLRAKPTYFQGERMEIAVKWQNLTWKAITSDDSAGTGDSNDIQFDAQEPGGHGWKYWYVRLNGREYPFTGGVANPMNGLGSRIDLSKDVYSHSTWPIGRHRVQYIARNLPVRLMQRQDEIIRAKVIASNEVEFEVVGPRDLDKPRYRFGPEQQIELRVGQYLNLGTGQLVAGDSAAPKPDTDAAEQAWLAQMGIDLYYESYPNVARWVSLKLADATACAETDAGLWDTLTADQVYESLAIGDHSPRHVINQYLRPGEDQANRKALVQFRTRTGQIGLLQAGGFSDGGSVVRIRYKLIQPAQASTTPASQPTSQAAASPAHSLKPVKVMLDQELDGGADSHLFTIRPEGPVKLRLSYFTFDESKGEFFWGGDFVKIGPLTGALTLSGTISVNGDRVAYEHRLAPTGRQPVVALHGGRVNHPGSKEGAGKIIINRDLACLTQDYSALWLVRYEKDGRVIKTAGCLARVVNAEDEDNAPPTADDYRKCMSRPAVAVSAASAARQNATQPTAQAAAKALRSRDLAGTWEGERDGVKARVEFSGGDNAGWRIESPRATIGATLKLVDDQQTGTVDLRLDYFTPATGKSGSAVIGKLERNAGALTLTVLPAAAQLESNYEPVSRIPLRKINASSVTVPATRATAASQPIDIVELRTKIAKAYEASEKDQRNLNIVATRTEYELDAATGQWVKTPAHTDTWSWYEKPRGGRVRIDADPAIGKWTGGSAPYNETRYLCVFDGKQFRKIDFVYSNERYFAGVSEKYDHDRPDYFSHLNWATGIAPLIDVDPNQPKAIEEFNPAGILAEMWNEIDGPSGTTTKPSTASWQAYEITQDGQRLVEVSLTYSQMPLTLKAVLNPQKGYALVRSEKWVNGRLSVPYQASEWKQLTPNLWFPTKWATLNGRVRYEALHVGFYDPAQADSIFEARDVQFNQALAHPPHGPNLPSSTKPASLPASADSTPLTGGKTEFGWP